MVAVDDRAGDRFALVVNDKSRHRHAVADDHYRLAGQVIGGGQAHHIFPAYGGACAAEGDGEDGAGIFS